MRKMQIPDIRILWSSDERITRQFETLDSTFTPVRTASEPRSRPISTLSSDETTGAPARARGGSGLKRRYRERSPS